MRFTKVHGNGNDFVVIDNREALHTTEELSRFARLLCRRKFSIGADGILVVEKAPGGEVDFAMRIFNADGSEGEMCGNGARALARYAFEKKLTASRTGDMCFTTPAGLIRARVEPPYAELDMGELDLVNEVFSDTLESCGLEFPFFFLTVGVPHCVLFMKDYDATDADLKVRIGRQVSHDFARFPKGANVSFAQALSDDDAIAVTYERGVENLTESCGTGCVAVAVAFAPFLRGRETGAPGAEPRTLRVHNPGGVNEVRLNFAPDNASCHAWLKGKTALVVEGEILGDAWL
ncbi:MAG: diaminopimelate epimerase [Synergistaceae bacterium]|jgi:diaminopimelate epimerase|nr:diaminopimelate epimerase [Synergistaceae bacterium]